MRGKEAYEAAASRRKLEQCEPRSESRSERGAEAGGLLLTL